MYVTNASENLRNGVRAGRLLAASVPIPHFIEKEIKTQRVQAHLKGLLVTLVAQLALGVKQLLSGTG